MPNSAPKTSSALFDHYQVDIEESGGHGAAQDDRTRDAPHHEDTTPNQHPPPLEDTPIPKDQSILPRQVHQPGPHLREPTNRKSPCDHTALDDQIRCLKEEIQTLKIALSKSEEENRHIRQRCAQFCDQATLATRRCTEFEQELRKRDETILTLRAQEASMRAAHPFLTSEDGYSGADITALVETLNYEVLQIAAMAANWLSARAKAQGGAMRTSHTEGPNPQDWINRVLSKALIRELCCFKHEEDSTLLQLAFQAVLCASCRSLVRSWSLGGVRGISESLNTIYNAMRENEPQSVSARWRALMCTQIKQLDGKAKAPLSIQKKLSHALIGIAVNSKLGWESLPDEFTSFLDDKLNLLDQQIRRIRDAIYLEVFSADIELVFIKPSQRFDPSEVTDGFGAQDASGKLACTTQLGLEMLKKVVKDGRTKYEYITLLKPQVLLDCSLREIVDGV